MNYRQECSDCGAYEHCTEGERNGVAVVLCDGCRELAGQDR
ncbi:MAG TPA: hypothetical protein VJY65_13705 [Chloroflexota bacterium]|nr:hypothetical protein [Chloroflexota bacterium]